MLNLIDHKHVDLTDAIGKRACDDLLIDHQVVDNTPLDQLAMAALGRSLPYVIGVSRRITPGFD